MPSDVLITPPAKEPLTLTEAKVHLRVDTTDDDDLIMSLVQAARMRVEALADLWIITQTRQVGLDAFPLGWTSAQSAGLRSYWGPWSAYWPTIEIDWPAQSVSSLTYVDPSGATQTVDPSVYRVDTFSRPCRVTPALNQIWPPTAVVSNAVLLTYVAGFGADGSFVPGDLREAIKLFLGHYYNNREEVLTGTRLVALQIPEGVEALLSQYAPAMVA